MSTVDCSRYQGVLSVPLLQGWKAAGVTRVILKVGGGDSGRYEDSQWSTNYPNVLRAGLSLEGYWFNGTTDPAGDAQFVNSIVPAGIRVWADVESEGSMPHWSDDQADIFETMVIAAGHPSGTYMSESVTFGSWPKCGRRPLWVADYGPNTVPAPGPSWSAPVLWQYTSTGHLPGYGGNLDLDNDLAGITATATPIPLETIMALKDSAQFFTNPTRGVFLGGPAAWLPIDNRDGIDGQHKLDIIKAYVGDIPVTAVPSVADWDVLNQVFKDWALASVTGK
jgi:GH25 family lysozyme M1 (1,4-beta-N-acetylmuramidase)